jgi:hypothetical protein
MECLDFVYFLGDFDYSGDAALKARGERGFGVGFLLEDEGGKQGNDFFGGVVCEHVFEDEFGEDEFVSRVDLTQQLV